MDFLRWTWNGGVERRAEPVKIWKARRLIENNYAERMSLIDVARQVGMNPTH